MNQKVEKIKRWSSDMIKIIRWASEMIEIIMELEMRICQENVHRCVWPDLDDKNTTIYHLGRLATLIFCVNLILIILHILLI